jgi:hypothetical protein
VPSLYTIFTRSPLVYTAFLRPGAYISGNETLADCEFASGENVMDILYIALIIGFIAVTVALTYFCETLRRPK